MDQLPSQSQVVIIGGGIIGCSVAYHLTKYGWTDVLLLEKGTLSCGTTWHAAGLVTQLRATHNLTRLAAYAADLYDRLHDETGQATGFRRTGSLSVARTRERAVELRRGVGMARGFGIEAHEVSSADARQMIPVMAVDDLVTAVFIPGDGTTNPTDTTQSLAKGARLGGARIAEGVKVTGVETRAGRVSSVTTEQGRVACEVVVNCAGMWARELGQMVGVHVPLHAAEHMYVVTRPMPGVVHGMPVLRDADGFIYVKEEVGGLLLGGFEPIAKPWGMAGIPEDFAFALLPDDWDQFEIFIKSGIERVPALADAEIRQLLVGPESFTPDNRFLLGEAPELRRYYVAAGFNSTGILSAAGVGRALAEWIIADGPTMDLTDVDIRRFAGWESNAAFLHDRTVESVGLLYSLHTPHRQPRTARGVRVSPLHERMRAAGACFEVAAGWERPAWFGPPGSSPAHGDSWDRPEWFERWAGEHRACRERVALFDFASYSKFRLEGPDAETVLQRICANDVAVRPGKVVYTAILNERGGIEADLTVTRLAETSYLIVTGAACGRHDLDWIGRHIPAQARAHLHDVTSGLTAISVMGPRARELVAAVSDADLANDSFPFGQAKEIGIGYATAIAVRITYVGELGWELYLPPEFAAGVCDTLIDAGAELGLAMAGYVALDSLRSEKGYRHWGRDITPETTPLEAGLGFAVALDRKPDFIGRDALLRQRDEAGRSGGLPRRLVQFTVDDARALLFHDEPIYRDGALVGLITSGSYGHTLARSVGIGYVARADGPVSDDYLASGAYEIDIAGTRFPATVHLRPPYDPTNSRVRA